jgi:hypothetical protein
MMNALYVRHRGKPEWGTGRVLSPDEESVTEAFFIHGGRRTIDHRFAALEEVRTPENDICQILNAAATVNWRSANHNVYVIELSSNIFRERRFFEANVTYIPDTKPCIYVGMTGLTPEERFRRHLAGIQAAFYVRRYGLALRPELYANLNPMPHDLAKAMELWLARYLRRQGYGVWQN